MHLSGFKKLASFHIPNKAHLSNVFRLQNNSSEMWYFIFKYAGPQPDYKIKQETSSPLMQGESNAGWGGGGARRVVLLDATLW